MSICEFCEREEVDTTVHHLLPKEMGDMYGYRKPYQPQDTRGLGLFALPFLGGLVGELLGSAFYPRPFYGYPGLGCPGSGFGF
jgi:hypothetical protein